MARKLAAAVGSSLWFLLLVHAAVMLLLLLGLTQSYAFKKAACEEVGVFVPGNFGPDECWAEDGSRRLFPEGWR